jgi:hypothetical protein
LALTMQIVQAARRQGLAEREIVTGRELR